MPMKRMAWRIPLKVILLGALTGACLAGTWLVDNPAVSIFLREDSIIHPFLYVGNGGVRTVRVCIDPNSPLIPEMTPGLQAATQTINNLQPATANFVATSLEVSLTANDFLSVAVHELLHCVAGIGHVNVAPSVATGLPGLSTNSFAGTDGTFNLANGGDAVYGTFDDPRGDDVNFFWFNRSTNDPFNLSALIDKNTYSRDPSALPAGHSFAANGNFIAAAAAGYTDLKPVMERVGFAGSENRLLAPDDTVNLRYGTAGVDEIAGTSDDYSLNIDFAGVSTTGCHVTVRFFDGAPGDLASCDVQAIALQTGSKHFRLAGTAEIKFNRARRWHFLGVSVFSDGFETGDLAAWSSSVP